MSQKIGVCDAVINNWGFTPNPKVFFRHKAPLTVPKEKFDVDFSFISGSYHLMELIESEIGKVLLMPWVHQVYLTTDKQTIVVELVIEPAVGLANENLLFFRPQTFSADRVNTTIVKIVTIELSKTD